MILAVLVAGVTTTFVKNDQTTPKAGPAPIGSTPSEAIPTASITPSSSASSSQRAPSKKTAVKRAQPDELSNVPPLPTSGVGRYPIGFVLIAGGLVVARWLRRVARA
jgi:hypothetical protein